MFMPFTSFFRISGEIEDNEKSMDLGVENGESGTETRRDSFTSRPGLQQSDLEGS